jgi:hypothetical protein
VHLASLKHLQLSLKLRSHFDPIPLRSVAVTMPRSVLLGCDLCVPHRQKVERLREARQCLNESGPGSDVPPCREVFAAKARESDVAIAANVGYRRRVANEEATAGEMLVKEIEC